MGPTRHRHRLRSPIQFSAEELAAHKKESKFWNQKAEFWDALHGFVSRGGWTSHENYDRAKAMLEGFREEGLKLMSGEELAEFEKIEIGQFLAMM